MEAARGSAAPPSELVLFWWCDGGRLPETGGVLDQDALTWLRMSSLSSYYRLTQKIDSAVGEQIHRLNASEKRGWKYLIDEGIW